MSGAGRPIGARMGATIGVTTGVSAGAIAGMVTGVTTGVITGVTIGVTIGVIIAGGAIDGSGQTHCSPVIMTSGTMSVAIGLNNSELISNDDKTGVTPRVGSERVGPERVGSEIAIGS